MSMPASKPDKIQALAERYLEAWNARDLERILALHAPDSEFRLHGADGVQIWKGIDAVRECFDYLLRAWPDQQFKCNSLEILDDMWIDHCTLTATLAVPWTMAGTTYQPTGRPISIEIADIMYCRGGRVTAKEGWIDGLAMHNQLMRGAA